MKRLHETDKDALGMCFTFGIFKIIYNKIKRIVI
jgi:hypothetical protein